MKEPEAGLVAHLIAFTDPKHNVPSAAAHLMTGAAETITAQATEIERLRTERDEARRELWCVVHGVGVHGKVLLFKADIENHPGDSAWMETATDADGNVTFRAFEQPPQSVR